MNDINREIGKKIRNFRKLKKITIEQLGEKIKKCKATISKYETGEITIDIVTLYTIADVLSISIDQLLYHNPKNFLTSFNEVKPTFFNGISQFYSYLFDGRTNQIIRCVFDISAEIEKSKYKIMMYMNFEDYNNYQNCENTYAGYIEHYDAMTNIFMTNLNTPMEKVTVSILASFLDSDTKWGLFFGISSRPMMPIAIKMFFSKKRLKEDDLLKNQLKISREDIRLLKLYNMLSAT